MLKCRNTPLRVCLYTPTSPVPARQCTSTIAMFANPYKANSHYSCKRAASHTCRLLAAHLHFRLQLQSAELQSGSRRLLISPLLEDILHHRFSLPWTLCPFKPSTQALDSYASPDSSPNPGFDDNSGFHLYLEVLLDLDSHS